MKLSKFNQLFRTIKRSIEKKQGIIDKSTQMEIKAYENKSKELLETAEIIEIAHADAKSIDGLKQQISTVQSAERELQHSLKELSNLPNHMKKTFDDQAHCLEELHRSKQKDYIRKKITKNNVEMKDFRSGNTVKTLKDNINNNLRNFKEEVAKLEFKIKSIEKGQAPKPPMQPSRQPAPDSPTDVRDHLKVLAGYFNDHGAYDEGKQYLIKGLDTLNDFDIIDNNTLQNLQNDINKPDITVKELIKIINTVTDGVNRDLKSRMERPVVGNHPQTFEERFADKFAGKKVENMKGNNQKDPTFAGRVKERMEENMKENDQVTRL